MSGGEFDYNEYHIEEIAERIQLFLDKTAVYETRFQEKTIEAIKEGLESLYKSYAFAFNLDLLISGDISEVEFHDSLKKETKKYKENLVKEEELNIKMSQLTKSLKTLYEDQIGVQGVCDLTSYKIISLTKFDGLHASIKDVADFLVENMWLIDVIKQRIEIYTAHVRHMRSSDLYFYEDCSIFLVYYLIHTKPYEIDECWPLEYSLYDMILQDLKDHKS